MAYFIYNERLKEFKVDVILLSVIKEHAYYHLNGEI